MTTPISISESDLHAMMRIIEAPDDGDDGVGLPWSTLHELRALIPSAFVSFNGIDLTGRRHYFMQDTDEPGAFWDEARLLAEDEDPVFWTHHWESPCAYPERTGDLRSVTKTTDLCELRDFRQTPIYTDLYKLTDSDHFLMVVLPDGPGRQLRLIFTRGRADPDFSERDRALLVLLRPHLHAAHLAVRHRRQGLPELTGRQWELLRLVDAGCSNTQIARQLNVTENTVRKHLENIFERLQVSSRVAAVARAFPERILT